MSEVREPFEWVEIDQDFCSRTYSVAPCAASLAIGNTECYNTRQTCQDPTNYDRSALTLRFCKNQAYLPEDAYYIPSLASVSLSAGSINPVGANQNSSALGTRGGISVGFQDHPHTDRYVDPYIANRVSRDAGYIATERGTFWSKWRARNQYYVGRQIRHCTGFIRNGVVTDVVTRTYFITGFDGPDSSGGVVIQGKDLLSQLTNEKAKAPFASKGKLLLDINESATSWTLDPIGIGAEYPASGLVRVGSELCTFTRVGDVLTVVRARHTTKAATAKAGTVVQLCLEYSAQAPMAILEDLLVNYAGIPTAYLDLAQWAQEQTDYMPRLYSAIITEPTGILDLISEMAAQMYFYTVWDERSSKLKVRAIRPAIDDTVHELDDFANLLVDSIQLRDLPEQLITQVWVYYGIINPAASATDPNNYAAREILLTDEGSANKHGSDKIKQIFCRWISETNGSAAIDLGEKMIARYGAAPRQATFSLSTKNSSIWLADFVRINHRLSVDMTGSPLPLNMQIMSAQQSRAGVLFNYVCQEFVYEQPVDPNDRLIIINTNQKNLNLRTVHDSMYAAPVGGETVRVVLRSGVVIGGDYYRSPTPHMNPLTTRYLAEGSGGAWNAGDFNTFRYGAPGFPTGMLVLAKQDTNLAGCTTSFKTGDWPVGVTLILTVEAGTTIAGHGGNGGNYYVLTNQGGTVTPGHYGIGGDGGHALEITYPISINNLGTIAGGGGGGAMYAPHYAFPAAPTAGIIIVGGGGAGDVVGGAWDSTPNGTYAIAREASGGSLLAGGSSAVGRASGVADIVAGEGGALGVDGGMPSNGFGMYGIAGNAIIQGANLITWTNKGDVRGPEAN